MSIDAHVYREPPLGAEAPFGNIGDHGYNIRGAAEYIGKGLKLKPQQVTQGLLALQELETLDLLPEARGEDIRDAFFIYFLKKRGVNVLKISRFLFGKQENIDDEKYILDSIKWVKGTVDRDNIRMREAFDYLIEDIEDDKVGTDASHNTEANLMYTEGGRADVITAGKGLLKSKQRNVEELVGFGLKSRGYILSKYDVAMIRARLTVEALMRPTADQKLLGLMDLGLVDPAVLIGKLRAITGNFTHIDPTDFAVYALQVKYFADLLREEMPVDEALAVTGFDQDVAEKITRYFESANPAEAAQITELIWKYVREGSSYSNWYRALRSQGFSRPTILYHPIFAEKVIPTVLHLRVTGVTRINIVNAVGMPDEIVGAIFIANRQERRQQFNEIIENGFIEGASAVQIFHRLRDKAFRYLDIFAHEVLFAALGQEIKALLDSKKTRGEIITITKIPDNELEDIIHGLIDTGKKESRSAGMQFLSPSDRDRIYTRAIKMLKTGKRDDEIASSLSVAEWRIMRIRKDAIKTGEITDQRVP